jgi:hypothetical protein
VGWPLGEPNILNVAKARDLSERVEDISSLTVLESTDLAKMLRERWKIPCSNVGP